MRHRVRLMVCDFWEVCQGILIPSGHRNSHLLLLAINTVGRCTVTALDQWSQCTMKDFWILLSSFCIWGVLHPPTVQMMSASFYTYILGYFSLKSSQLEDTSIMRQCLMLSQSAAVVMKQYTTWHIKYPPGELFRQFRLEWWNLRYPLAVESIRASVKHTGEHFFFPNV